MAQMNMAQMEPGERLLAFEEIRQLAHRYAVCLDARDLDGLCALYIPDVQAARGARGREALRGDFDRALRRVGITFLQVGTHAIDLHSAQRAGGVVYCRGEIQDGGPDSQRFIVQAIQYHDEYERREGRWLFRSRRHLLVYGAELGQNPLTLPPANWPQRQTGMGSVPGELESWRRFWAREL